MGEPNKHDPHRSHVGSTWAFSVGLVWAKFENPTPGPLGFAHFGPVGPVWEIGGIEVGPLWDVCGILWDMCRIHVGLVWEIGGIDVVPVWDVYGILWDLRRVRVG